MKGIDMPGEFRRVAGMLIGVLSVYSFIAYIVLSRAA